MTFPGCSYAPKTCDRVYGHVINKGIDRVMGILNDRDLPGRDESAAFQRKPTGPSGIRKTVTQWVHGINRVTARNIVINDWRCTLLAIDLNNFYIRASACN